MSVIVDSEEIVFNIFNVSQQMGCFPICSFEKDISFVCYLANHLLSFHSASAYFVNNLCIVFQFYINFIFSIHSH